MAVVGGAAATADGVRGRRPATVHLSEGSEDAWGEPAGARPAFPGWGRPPASACAVLSVRSEAAARTWLEWKWARVAPARSGRAAFDASALR